MCAWRWVWVSAHDAVVSLHARCTSSLLSPRRSCDRPRTRSLASPTTSNTSGKVCGAHGCGSSVYMSYVHELAASTQHN